MTTNRAYPAMPEHLPTQESVNNPQEKNLFSKIINSLYGQNPYDDFKAENNINLKPTQAQPFDFLIANVAPKIVLEIGSWQGSSAIKMAQLLEQYKLADSVIICVDTWLGSPLDWIEKNPQSSRFALLNIINGFPHVYQTFLSNVVNSNLQDKIIPFPQTAENAAAILKSLKLQFDLIYLDATYKYQSVSRNLEYYWQMLSDRGIVFGEGYPGHDEVCQAVNDFAKKLNLKLYFKFGKFILLKPEQELQNIDRMYFNVGPIKSAGEIITQGLKAREEGKEEEAISYFQKVFAHYPYRIPAHFEIGKSLINLGRLEEAQQKFEYILETKPDHIGTLMQLGDLLALQGKREQALEKFQKIIALDSNNLNAYGKAALQLRELRRFLEAEKIADSGLNNLENTEDWFYYTLLREKAFALIGQAKIVEGSELLRRFFSLRGNIYIFVEAMIILSSQKQFDEAHQFLEFNRLFIKENDDDWVLWQRHTGGLRNAKFRYLQDLNTVQHNQEYDLYNLHPQKPVIKLPLHTFGLDNINSSHLTVFESDIGGTNLNQGFDDLDGLLSREKEDLSVQGPFKQHISTRGKHSVFLIPRATCGKANLEGEDLLLFSLDGYFISELFRLIYPSYYSHHCISKKKKKVLPLGFFLPLDYGNYYHTLSDSIASIKYYKQLGIECPVICCSKSTNVHREIFQRLKINPEQILSQEEAEGIVFEKGIAPFLTLDITIVEFYRDIANKTLEQYDIPSNLNNSDKIYISRRTSAKKKLVERRLIDEEELEALLISMGFSVCYMENYSFAEQVMIMQNASIVVSPHGAGLVNMLFCNPGTTVVELVLDKYPNTLYYNLSLLCGHKYYPILGNLVENHLEKGSSAFPWTVDLEKVRRVLAKLLENN